MRKFLWLTSLCMAICTSVIHAQKLSNTLLWRISGNGLQKPSYLYGTMHHTDERLFNLGDSLYNAIENSDGFAIEVDPEQLTAYIIDEINQQIKNPTFIQKILSKQEFEAYSEPLSKKLKKPADKITTRDILLEKNKWVRESFKNGKMSTFLDAYLFDVARRQGKWTGGVEDLADQTGLLDDVIDEADIKEIASYNNTDSKGKADDFIKLYSASNLNAIDSISNLSDSAYEYDLVTKRNHKMSSRIDSLGRIRSTVFAIGAAHLPGTEGLISLLQKKGYAVQPVFSSKKINPQNYKVKENTIPWISVNDADSLFTINMPGNPGNIEMYGLLKMKMYFDLFSSTAYMATAVNTPYNKRGIDSIINSYAQDFFKQKISSNTKTVIINNISGKELEVTDEDGYKHGYILYKNNVIYLVVALTAKKNPESQKAMNNFLSSYKPFEKKENYTTSFFAYTDSTGLYSVSLPSKPASANNLVAAVKDKSINTNLMVSIDNQTGAYFFFGLNKTEPGYYLENDSTFLRNLEKNIKAKFSSISSDTFYTSGEKRVVNIEGTMAKANLYAKAHYELKSNRWYALLVMYDSSKANPAVEQFFKSFTIHDPKALSWKQQSSEDNLISTWMPGAIKYYRNDSSGLYYTKKYESYDTMPGNSYDVFATGLSKYYWFQNDSAFWKATAKSNTGYQDSVLFQQPVTNGDIKGIELQLKENTSFNIRRKRILLYGDTLYTLLAVLPQQNINDSNTNKFFEDFRFKQKAPLSNIYDSKAKLLLSDLTNEDSTVRENASKALGDANFAAVDLPLLYEYLLKTYVHKSDSYLTLNEELAKVIKNIKDSSSLKTAKEKYHTVTSKQIKSLLLDIISEYKTKENYDDLKNLLTQSHPDTTLSYSFINNVKDSLPLAAYFINGILPLIKDSLMAPAIVTICATLIDSNLIPVSSLNIYQENIIKMADGQYKKLKKDSTDYTYQDISAINLLGKINTPQSNAMLQKLLSVSVNYRKVKCIEILLQNGQGIPPAFLLKVAADKYVRIELYNSLEKEAKLNLFPKQYLAQQYFAESNIYSAASDNDDEPSGATFIMQKNILFHGKQARFFFYNVTFGEEDKTHYLGAAGPFDLNTSNMSAEDASGYIYYKEEFKQSDLQQQIKALIKQVESGE